MAYRWKVDVFYAQWHRCWQAWREQEDKWWAIHTSNKPKWTLHREAEKAWQCSRWPTGWLPRLRCHNPASSLYSPGSSGEQTSVSGEERQTNGGISDDQWNNWCMQAMVLMYIQLIPLSYMTRIIYLPLKNITNWMLNQIYKIIIIKKILTVPFVDCSIFLAVVHWRINLNWVLTARAAMVMGMAVMKVK